jgi:hypothetical protein
LSGAHSVGERTTSMYAISRRDANSPKTGLLQKKKIYLAMPNRWFGFVVSHRMDAVDRAGEILNR